MAGTPRDAPGPVVPIEAPDADEARWDLEDARIANERLADVDAGREAVYPAAEVFAELGL